MSKENPVPQREPFVLTPDLLRNSNQSLKSQERIAAYLDAREQGNLTLLWQCADARSGPSLFDTDAVATDRSIAAGANPLGYADALRNPAIARIVIAPHFDGVDSRENGRFMGCGGQDAFNAFGGAHANEPHEHPVARWVGQRVHSDNPFIQAFKQKDAIVRQFSSEGEFKPVMVGAIDHRTGLFVPVWYNELDGNGTYHTHGTIVQSNILQNPSLITPSNMRALPSDQLSNGFRELVESNADFVGRNPEFPITQETQDPSVIWVTTSLIPLRNRFADLCDSPNRIFVVGAPFVKHDGEVHVTDVDPILSQVSYPIGKTLHAEHEGDAFYSTRTIVFEAPDIGEAASLAASFCDTDFGRKWLNERGGKILLVETVSGQTQKVQEMPTN